jgi:DNA-binding PadR family transcriptional regulator
MNTGSGEHVETAKFCRNMQRRTVRNFLDVLILAEMRKGPLSGYDVMTFVHDRFRFLVSSGTIYSVLYSLERNGLVSGVSMQRKRVYRLTDKGKEAIRGVMSAGEETRYLVSGLLKLQNDAHDR